MVKPIHTPAQRRYLSVLHNRDMLVAINQHQPDEGLERRIDDLNEELHLLRDEEMEIGFEVSD